MSEDISRLPPHIQQRLLRLQQLQQTLQGVMAQRQQLEMQLTEVEQATGELEKLDETAVVYKSIGALLVKSEKDKVTTELTERKELLTMRVDVLTKQEERLRTQVKDLQDKLQQDLRPVSGSAQDENRLAETGIPELTLEQVEELCERGEQAARDYVLSKVSIGRIATLDVSINAEGTKPVTVDVDVTVVLSPLMKDFDVEALTKEAINRAFAIIEEYLRELRCKSNKQ